MLARAQCRGRGLVVGATREMEASDAFDGDDPSVSEGPSSGLNRIRRAGAVSNPAGGVEQRDRRTALWTCVWLRVEASVAGVVVLPLAAAAHLKTGHRRQRTVIRDAADDREPRAAVRAVGKRIAKPSIGGIEELTQAVLAGCGIRRDGRIREIAA